MAAIESATTSSPATGANATATPLVELPEGEELSVTYTQTLLFSRPSLDSLAAPAATAPAPGIESLVSAITTAITNALKPLVASIEKAVKTLSDLVTKLVEELKKPAETKPAETKPAETKPAETKPAETKPTESGPLSPGTLSFAEKEKTVLKADENGRVSETELRRGVAVYQLYQKDTKLGDTLEKYYEEATKAGDAPAESLKKALSRLVEEKKLEKWEANWVYSLSHRAAQFEGSQTALSTTSKAPSGMEKAAAIKIAEAALVGIQTGTVEVKPLTI